MQQINTFFVAALLLLATFGILHAQNAQNMSLLYQYDDPAIVKYNDVWGYTDNGTEVAIIGTRDSILFFDVTDTTQVDKLPSIAPGGSSNWRDFKTYGNFCYGVIDLNNQNPNEGLTIVNMNDLLSGTVTYKIDTSDFVNAHNLWIDTAMAKLYVVGSNTESGGYLVYDLQADPFNPVHLASVDLSSEVSCSNTYIHDIFVRNDTAYCNMNSTCGYYIFDVSTPSSPVYLGHRDPGGFQNGYNHSNWVSQDGNVAVVTEENLGKPVHFVDISDLSNMQILSTFMQPLDTPHTDNIAHNPFIKGNFCYISYYHDGVVVLDISDPANPVRVAYYDTHPDVGYSGYQGAWGVYPFLPSGNVLVSDINNGLFVLSIEESVLAVEWIEFEAQATGKEEFSIFAELQSTQALEKVELYWSETGDNFKLLSPLQAKRGIHNIYTITESLPRPTPSSFYVQIRSTEVDGHRSTSTIRRVEPARSDGFHIYPNPAQTKIHVSHENAARLEIFDVLGKLVQQEPLTPGINTFLLNENLQEGMYTAIWRGADQTILESRQLYIRP